MKSHFSQKIILLICITWLIGCVSKNTTLNGKYYYICVHNNCRNPKVKLNKNHTFLYTESPIHESKKGFRQKGTWSYRNDTLTLKFYDSEFYNDLHYIYDSTLKDLAFRQDTFGWLIKKRK